MNLFPIFEEETPKGDPNCVNSTTFEVIHFARGTAVTSVQITHDFDADAHF